MLKSKGPFRIVTIKNCGAGAGAEESEPVPHPPGACHLQAGPKLR